MANLRIDLICPASNRDGCNAHLSELWETDQGNSFVRGLNPSGSTLDPITHFGCSGVYPEGMVPDVLAYEGWTARLNVASESLEGFVNFAADLNLRIAYPPEE